MRPVTFVKEHPVAVIVNMAAGMMIGPWILATIGRFTGVTISLPNVRGKVSAEQPVPVKGGYLALTGAGAIFVWSGLKGKSVTDVFHALIGGQSPASAKAANSITSPAAGTGSGGTGSGGTGPAGSGSVANASQLQQYAFSLFPQYGWGADQQQPLVKLWNQESGWRWDAKNPSSGAYGIPQSLPASKMASAGSDWQTNPQTQIKWGLSYISGRYGTPQGAWNHEVSNNWYQLMATAGVIVLTAGTITFANDWYQTRNVNWKVPVATVLLAAGIDALDSVSPVAATGLAIMVLIGASTTKFGGKSFADTISGALTTKAAAPAPVKAPPAPVSRGGHSI